MDPAANDQVNVHYEHLQFPYLIYVSVYEHGSGK